MNQAAQQRGTHFTEAPTSAYRKVEKLTEFP